MEKPLCYDKSIAISKLKLKGKGYLFYVPNPFRWWLSVSLFFCLLLLILFLIFTILLLPFIYADTVFPLIFFVSQKFQFLFLSISFFVVPIFLKTSPLDLFCVCYSFVPRIFVFFFICEEFFQHPSEQRSDIT